MRCGHFLATPSGRIMRNGLIFLGLPWLALFWLALSLPAQADAFVPVGQVTFVTGHVQMLRGTNWQSIDQGDPVYQGDRLRTGSDGYIQLRMVDDGLVSLRTDSELMIESYRYAPEAPTDNRVKLKLISGAVRSVTGAAGQANKQGFRLNTPVAAIGIRGTDFTVFTTRQRSILSVRAGGVVMSPFTPTCQAETLGPCGKKSSAVLSGRMPGTLLEAAVGDHSANLVRNVATPNDKRPPHPSEASLLNVTTLYNEVSSVSLARGDVAAGAESYAEGLLDVERYVAEPGLAREAYALGEAMGSVIQPRDKGLSEMPSITWGRWSNFADQGDGHQRIARLIYDGRQYAAVNSVFALLEAVPESRNLPETGRGYFELNRYEAYIKRGSDLESASISHPALVVDFDDSRFATRLDVHAASLPGPVHVVGGGNILGKGFLRSDGDSPSRLEGVLGADGANEAGLLFEYQVSPGVDAVGATHWVRDGE